MKSKLLLALLLLALAVIVATHFVVIDRVTRTVNSAITDSTQAVNATVTKVFVNDLYPRIKAQLSLEGPEPPKALSGAALDEVDKLIRTFIFGTDIMKVKLFGVNGLTIYSTELAQVGQDQQKNPALIDALQGAMGTQITHKGKFNAAEGEVFDRDLVSSYIPIRNKAGAVIGAAEIYTDRTRVIAQARQGGAPVRPFLTFMQAIEVVLLVFIGLVAWSLRGAD